MATTITVSEPTRRRLADYKRGESTFDEVLNDLMDRVPLEDVALDQIEEAYRRLQDFRPVSLEEFRRHLKGRIAAGQRRGRRPRVRRRT